MFELKLKNSKVKIGNFKNNYMSGNTEIQKESFEILENDLLNSINFSENEKYLNTLVSIKKYNLKIDSLDFTNNDYATLKDGILYSVTIDSNTYSYISTLTDEYGFSYLPTVYLIGTKVIENIPLKLNNNLVTYNNIKEVSPDSYIYYNNTIDELNLISD